ncbi:MAG: hypothetical protein P8R54_07960 [Myxococcota bacterium]|nr:hypothetical protein [Myxococcota bacterium]
MIAVILSTLASAAPPWFDLGGAERMVASGLPEYYAFLQETAQADPERYEKKVHQAMMLLLSGETNPQVLEAWKEKFYAEDAYRETLARWRTATVDQRAALRSELLQRSAAIESAHIRLLQVKQPLTATRLDNIDSDIKDIRMNREAYALERVMNSLNE